MPAAAVEKILVEQRDWMKDRSERTGEDFHTNGSVHTQGIPYTHLNITIESSRRLQKT